MDERWVRHGGQSVRSQTHELVGDSSAMVAVRGIVERVARSAASVLVTGPSGSGKEVVAQRLHTASDRAAKPFVAVNCAAIPRDLLESELFGHEAGAFTGAIRARRGRFEAADGGTLFLDEIGDMPADMQVKLLRVLETRIVERVGGNGVRVDVRLIAATNADLQGAIAAGRFREDLYYRLNVVEVALPPLADRACDIPLLIQHFTANVAPAARVRLTHDALMWLAQRPWRGNVRELRNFVDRATALHPGETIDRDIAERLSGVARQPIDTWVTAPSTGASHPLRMPSALLGGAPVDLKALLDEVEQAYIEHALQRSAGTIADGARLLGLRRTTLIEKMRRLGIQRPDAL